MLVAFIAGPGSAVKRARFARVFEFHALAGQRLVLLGQVFF